MFLRFHRREVRYFFFQKYLWSKCCLDLLHWSIHISISSRFCVFLVWILCFRLVFWLNLEKIWMHLNVYICNITSVLLELRFLSFFVGIFCFRSVYWLNLEIRIHLSVCICSITSVLLELCYLSLFVGFFCFRLVFLIKSGN